MRQTKIIFTIGPATTDPRVLMRLIENGVDVCRFNMAHADHAWVRHVIDSVKVCSRQVGREVAFLMDIKGPEIRTRDVPQPIALRVGQLIEFRYWRADLPPPRDAPADVTLVGVNYPDFSNDVSVGDTVLVDSGLIRMTVENVADGCVRCRVAIPGELGSRRHINLPGVKVNLPSLTEKDRADVLLGIEQEIDFFALSFVREADDMRQLRAFLLEHGSHANIVAKIEDHSGIEHFDEIVEASDGLMVARGDLGIETPLEELPSFQRRAVNRCLEAGKPVIIATHMLESMIHSPIPTRAEITDVCNAVRERADCVMLSGETTVGKFPEKCVEVINKIVAAAQADLTDAPNTRLLLDTPKEKMLRAAVKLAEELGNAGIVVFTRSGDLARLLSALRPRSVPIYAFTDIRPVFKQMLMLWGVEPFQMNFEENPEETILNAFTYLRRKKWARNGELMVTITNVLGSDGKIIDSLQLREVQ